MVKLILLTEIYDEPLLEAASRAGRLDGTFGSKTCFLLRELVINPEHVVMIRENISLKEKIVLKGWPDGLDERVAFCKLTFNSGTGHGGTVNVVGDLTILFEKLQI